MIYLKHLKWLVETLSLFAKSIIDLHGGTLDIDEIKLGLLGNK